VSAFAFQFSGVYVPGILDGTKRTTIRARRPRCEIAQTMRFLNGYRPHAQFAEAQVVSMRQITHADITTRIARDDGFSSLDELLGALHARYPSVQSFWLVRWSQPVMRVRRFFQEYHQPTRT